MTPSFLASLTELVKLLPQIRELCTRQSPIQEAIVTNNADPTGLRRVRVTREAQGGQSESDWLPAGRATSFTDEPIPPVGTHCLIALVDGDPHKPFMLRTLSNATNPPDTGQLSPTDDNTTRIPGSDRQLVEQNRAIDVRGEREETVGGDCYLTVKGKKYQISAEFGEILINALASGVGRVAIASDLETKLSSETAVRLEQGGGYAELIGGAWKMGNASGQTWTLGGTSGTQWVWDLNGGSVEVVNASGFSINGKQVIVLNSTDSSGDINNSRGY